jgi:tRNA (pseudouridine54-N1)-methyltransferase
MPSFVVVGHRARTAGDFSLNDMPGSAGRMDILCRCVNTSFFLSHDLRRDVELTLVLCGEPDPPKTVLLRGSELRYLSPDERSAGSLLKKALALPCGETFRESTPGVYVRRAGFAEAVQGQDTGVLDEHGEDLRRAAVLPARFLLADHMDFSDEEKDRIRTLPAFSVGPRSLHADHVITTVLNELDRRNAGWTS